MNLKKASILNACEVTERKVKLQESLGFILHLRTYESACRSGIELEKKGYAESYEQGQEMQKKLVSVASEVEKLRAEVANAEKRSRAAVSAGNQGLLFH